MDDQMDIKGICARCGEPETTADEMVGPMWTLLVTYRDGPPQAHAHMACMTPEERGLLTTFFNSLLPPSVPPVQTPEESLGNLARDLDEWAASTDEIEGLADAGLFPDGEALRQELHQAIDTARRAVSAGREGLKKSFARYGMADPWSSPAPELAEQMEQPEAGGPGATVANGDFILGGEAGDGS
jgi:hypothetical protein